MKRFSEEALGKGILIAGTYGQNEMVGEGLRCLEKEAGCNL